MAAKYQAYPEYKDSGVEWLGAIPKHWEVSRVKFIGKLNPSKNKIRNLPINTEITFLPMEAIGDHGELDTSRTKPLEDVINGYTYLEEGDVCIAKITPCFENGKGAVLESLKNNIAFATTEVIPLRCHSSEDRKFLYYLLTSAPFNKQAEGSMYGAGGQKRVADSFVANYHFALPTLSERPKISNFLDHETAKIDTLIEKQQQLIALLKEKRQAVISHAVTKGLNPHVKMKDSGVEWLGEVPDHWEVLRFKTLFQIKKRIAGKLGYDILSITQKGIKIKNIESGDGQLSMDYSKYQLVFKGDFAMNHMDLLTGFVDISKYDGVTSPDYRVFTLKNKDSYAEYYLALLQMCYLDKIFFPLGQGAATLGRWRLPSEAFNEFLTPKPPFTEQIEIADFINHENNKLEILLEKAQQQIELLQERRTALISAAVTGKIDVREWQT